MCVNGDKVTKPSADALSVVFSWKGEDVPAGMGFRHDGLAVETRMVPPLRQQQVLSCCWYHTSASVQQCLCEDLCIGVRCEIHRCSVVFGVARR